MGDEPVGDPTDRRLAGFWLRFLGWAVDHLIILTFFLPAVVALFAVHADAVGCHLDLDHQVTGFGDANAICNGPTSTTWTLVGALVFLAVIGALLYQGLLAGGPSGQTLGMRAAGVRLVDVDSGDPIGGVAAACRFIVGATVSGWFFSLGYLWSAWDSERQTWHDKVTSAVVIKT